MKYSCVKKFYVVKRIIFFGAFFFNFSLNAMEPSNFGRENNNSTRVKKVWDLYQDYCNKLENSSSEHKRLMAEMTCRFDINRLLASSSLSSYGYPKILNKLNIQLPTEKIEEIYNNYGIIQLRLISKKK